MALHYHRHEDDSRLHRNAGYETDISTQLLRMGCAICGRPLRDPVSLERGWGPICDEKWVGGAGDARVFSQMAEDFDPEEAALAMREAPKVTPERWVEPIINQETGRPYIERKFKRGETLPDGTKALGGEILTKTRPIRPGSLYDYWIEKGGSPDDPNAPWRHDMEVRRKMVSNGIWYASRAVTFGFEGHVVSAEKVDPKWMVVASVQRFARAVGLPGAAMRMTEFYGAQVTKFVREEVKAAQKRMSKHIVVFERVDPKWTLDVWDPNTRRKDRRAAGPNIVRVHVPYSQEFNGLARKNEAIFFAREGEKDAWERLRYKGVKHSEVKEMQRFWRYFHQKDLRQVVNIIQGVFGDQLCISKGRMTTVEERAQFVMERRDMVRVVDVETAEVRFFTKQIADQLVKGSEYESVDSKGRPVMKPGRYRLVEPKK